MITSPTGRRYIGSSINIDNRWKQYIKGYCDGQHKLKNSFLKYGSEAHTFEIIAITTPGERLKWEHILGMYYDVLGEKGMNCILPGYDDIPAIYSDETREKIAKIHIGAKRSEESKKRMSIAQMGKKMAPESIAKTVAANKGRKYTPEQIINYCKGQANRNEDWLRKIGESKQKLVLDTYTGIFYNSAKEACLVTNYKYEYFCSMLIGKKRNRTTLQYV